jgi:hypothetical protein
VARFRDVLTSFTRTYEPGGPLYAASALKFQGQAYATGDALPVEKMSKARHQRLFITKQANHTPARKASPTPTALPAVPVQPGLVPVSDSKFSTPPGYAETLDAQRVAFKVPAGERDVVDVETPAQQAARTVKPKKK